MTLKTSQEWHDELQVKYPNFMVMDADGWDRKNYQYSWHVELITNEEFQSRVSRSTCMWPRDMLDDLISGKFK